MLEVSDVSVFYGRHRAVENVSVKVSPGEIVVMLGANGAGKSALLRAIAGLTRSTAASKVADGRQETFRIGRRTKSLKRASRWFRKTAAFFADLTVKENLTLGAYPKRARPVKLKTSTASCRCFRVSANVRSQLVRTMSGGERQMVAVGRAMMSAADNPDARRAIARTVAAAVQRSVSFA